MQARALLMRDAADEIERLRAAPLTALDAETPPSVAQVQILADAMWQVLDDMGADSRSVCPATKARARVAYQPFRFTDDNGDDGLDMPLSELRQSLRRLRPLPSPPDRQDGGGRMSTTRTSKIGHSQGKVGECPFCRKDRAELWCEPSEMPAGEPFQVRLLLVRGCRSLGTQRMGERRPGLACCRPHR